MMLSRARLVPAAKPRLVGAPMGGINAKDPLRSMPSGDALSLVNWVVRQDGLNQRKGYASRSTGLTGGVTALMRAGESYFAGTPTAIYNITSTGAGSSVVSGLSGGRWSWDTFAGGAGVGLIACNGIDTPRYFLGGSWGTCGITGVTPAYLMTVAIHGRRPFFTENGSFRVWYLGINAIGGAAKMLDFAPHIQRGGEISGIASLHPDGGRNAASRFVMVTTMGEMVVYAGFDPDNAATWALVGVFDVPRPVGRLCFSRVGGVLVYLSVDGLMSVPDLLGKAASNEQSAALTEKIERAYRAAVSDAEDDGDPFDYFFDSTAYTMDSSTLTLDLDHDASPGTEASWTVLESASENILIINRYRTGGNRQYVIDPRVSGWSEWTGLAATCWLDTGRELWFGTAAGTVQKYTGTTDNGSAIDSLMVEAYARASGRVDRQSQVTPLFSTAPTYRPRVKFVYDFAAAPSSYTASTQAYQPAGQSVAGRGRDAAFCMAIKSGRGAVYIGRDSILEAGSNP